MKKSNVRQVIRQIVREEVAMAINEVITELKQPTQPIKKVSKPQTRQRVTEKKNFSNNSIINDVLNETAQTKAEWEELGGGTFDSSRMTEVMTKQYEGMGQNGSSAQLAASVGADPNNPPDFLTKDYSKLMKKVDEKAKQTRG
tara:strand:+ start:80 stop:508 length:429 start_codon:yes stop_codon:yes gene_type:complete